MGSHFASEKSAPVRRGYAIDLALLALLSVAAFIASAVMALGPRDPTSGVAVVFAPWVGADAALSRAVEAKARFVRFGGASFLVVVVPDDADYQTRVLNAGAWLVLDPQALAACLPFLNTAPQGT